MIKLKDVSILDILPHTFKTDEYKALAAAIKSLTATLHEKVSRALFWASVTSVTDDALLDAMAAELDAPFYSTDMPTVQKQSIILGAFEYNRQIGTVSSVEKLLAAAFGVGEVSEWFDYDGDPYHFKLIIHSRPPFAVTKAGCELLESKLTAATPKRARLDEVVYRRSGEADIFVGITAVQTLKKRTIPAAQTPGLDRGYS